MKFLQSNLLIEMKRREIIAENSLVKLIKQKRDHKTWYELTFVFTRNWHLHSEILNHFGNTSSIYATKYRFWNRVEAEKQFTYATLRWG
jgi:hypothetical protein